MTSRLDDAFVAAIVASSPDAIISANLDSVVTSWNAAAHRMFGYAADEALGQPARLIAVPGAEQEQRQMLARAAAGEILENVETVRRRKDGTSIALSMTVSPLRDAAGQIVGVSAIARELDPERRVDRAARRLAAIVESSDDAIVSKDLNGIVRSWNRAAERMFGYSSQEMIGTSIRRIVPADRQTEEDEVLAKIRRGDRIEHYETLRQQKSGTLIPISLTVSPIRDENGTVVGASKIARDISERRAFEAERDRLLNLAREQAAFTAKLNQVGFIVSSTLDHNVIVQAVTDTATAVTTAEFGAFFNNTADPESAEGYRLHALSGAPKEAFANFGHPRATAIFAPTFRGETVRIDDVTKDRRYGQSAPYFGMPPGHLPVRSYLAVPVKARSGEVIGGLIFGHATAARFTREHERLAEGIAAWASVALENARLFVEANDANRLKDEFLATLSHELRTPLNAILGYARMLRAGLMAPDRQPRTIETIERNATALSQIVEDVLDVSRIVSGKIRLAVQAVELPDVVRHAIEAVRVAADAKGVAIAVTTEDGPAAVSGDPDRLQQAIWNVVANAVKFTPAGGRVDVRLVRADAHMEIVVIDTGIGIPPSFLPHLFERFRQGDAAITRERGGLGLGLSIAKHLVEMHGGTISAASEGQGRGSTFRIRLPVIHQEQPPANARGVGAHRRTTSAGFPDLGGIRVLAVDDDSDALRLVAEILEAAGAEVTTAASALDALKLLHTGRPDVLIADLGMPRMDGFELISEVRRHADPSVQRIPAAALTAYARSEDRAKALGRGYQLHLAKPIDPRELMTTVATLVRRAAPDRRSVG